MPAPVLTQANFLAGLQALLPRGRAWPRDPDAVITAVLNGLAAVHATQAARANVLLVDGFPATTDELLPDWQDTLALPDPNGPPPADLAEAQRQVVAKFANSGGQSTAFFIAFAAALGITILIVPHAPFRAGQSRAGDHVGGSDWFVTWYISMPAAYAAYEGLFREIAPAHTVLNFTLT